MRKHVKAAGSLIAAGAALALAAPALAADSLGDSIEQFLADTQRSVDEAKLWKIQVKPSLKESLIWTDNVYMNDVDEDNVVLRRYTTAGGRVITDPGTLSDIENSRDDFSDSEGRVGDWMIQTDFNLDFVIPVNEEYTKAFKTPNMRLLYVEVRNQEYFDVNELDNSSIYLGTDLYSFLTDLLNFEAGNNIWVRTKDEYSHVRDPLDSMVRQLRSDGITDIASFEDFGRTENTFNFDTGWRGAQVDASIGYENYILRLDDEALSQADHTRQDFHAEAGTKLPGLVDKRAYVRLSYTNYHFGKAPLYNDFGQEVDEAQILNDADVKRGVLGIEGPFLGDRVRAMAEAGYENWDADEDGLAGDRSSFHGPVGHAMLAYSPYGEEVERKTTFQFEYERRVGFSSISNYNDEHDFTLSVLHEAIPKRLDVDANVSLLLTAPSDGPRRKLFQAGVGAVYHLFPQADLSLRYLFQHQVSTHEIENNSSFTDTATGALYEYTIQSDGDFYQNIVELALDIHF